MQSIIHLFNTAIGRLGGEQIPINRSPLENDTTGQLCQNLFPHVLDMALSAHEWAFAKKRTPLAPCPQEICHDEYSHCYALPADCARPVELAGPVGINRTAAYVIEGECIHTTWPNALLVYIERVTDPRRWPPAFAEALAWALAAELAAARINDTGKQQWCMQNYASALSIAIARDKAMQNPRPRRSAWMDARGVGHFAVSLSAANGGVR